MKKILLLIALFLVPTLLFAPTHTGAFLDIVQTFTAQHTFSGGLLSTKPADADSSATVATTSFIIPSVTTSTSGPVSDPGGTFAFLYNNAAGALTFNAPAGVLGLERCYRNATGKSGAITVQMAASNTVDIAGVNGSAAGTLVSGGALGDGVCINSDATNHWYGSVVSGTWTNN